MSLYDILACPICKTSVELIGDSLRCSECARQYPVVNGVPIMLPDAELANVRHEGELVLREGYDPWIHRMIMHSLTDSQVVLDAGCGNMILDDPCIIRMDVRLTPYVDLVGDLHALPFRPATIDFVFALAVFEHLRQPFTAGEEIYGVLKPGGYAYAESNFVFAYHGHPHHYFNASIHGLRQIFSRFTEQRVGVAPYQMPSFALESLLGTYLNLFEVKQPAEARFVQSMRRLLKYPLRSYDAKFTPDKDFRVAAGDYFLGIKQPSGQDSIIPSVILEVYTCNPELQARYPDPNNLAVPDNLMIWAKTEGCHLYPQIAAYFAALEPFSKYTDPLHSVDRSTVKSWSVIAHPDEQRFIVEAIDDMSRPEKIATTFRMLVGRLLGWLRSVCLDQ